MTATKIFEPFSMDFDLARGIMKNPDAYIERKASSMQGHYRDDAALQKLVNMGDPLHYEVFEADIPEEPGHLRICISKLQPGLVGNEYFMTKGHYHTVSGTAEVYLCLAGEGYMLMKTADGLSAKQPFKPGGMVYVPPHWAHRSVNTGSVPLISFCVYPGEAGHNYGDIEKEGFPMRVIEKNGEVEFL